MHGFKKIDHPISLCEWILLFDLWEKTVLINKGKAEEEYGRLKMGGERRKREVMEDLLLSCRSTIFRQ